MLESTRHNYRLVTIFISTIAAGLPLWTSSTRQTDFTDTGFLVLWIAIGILASFVVRFIVNLDIRTMVGSFAIGYVIAVVVHFVSSILLSSYVQARFELFLLIALLAGITSGGLGSLLWMGIKKSGSKKK
jgi:RsiW-degrading membrane proteinase PrsW (M82 family)